MTRMLLTAIVIQGLVLVAKQSVPNAGDFIALETAYLVVQFGLLGLRQI